ncbi:folate family ECF transporter S component [Anaerosalibacter bizertensis]|uniref:Folate family ECF transporter S component n=1 Tax=Anaerosalibacter bizertensis TaxID=932217 RepID=A0A9Q4FML5_9FIRM|nr:folate family ECF transporter S component [Anaerosalibacter bizertensis]MBV1819557.1 folate family ECF transporter S component [Bacteroidales bacterium MSK.15.36]MCB5560601.1 folate family ECF transporter S component [Anaerosalibacter bizertensis]MCG4565869.1 folate family ECF transporter S component [Anaerosalibacter bizertensis]MCG4583385.1 folate family ECF transporter S component [Anaerosalibacter bizertensis]MCG4584893.1 folate family ECF transporter S component [Anaerosalibacter bizer
MDKRRLSTKNMVYYAILMALNVVLTRVGSIRIGGGGVELVRIGFGGYPIIFAGIAFGPLAGGIVGTIGDIVGHFMSPMGPYMPHFTMTAALTGIIPGIVMMLFKENKNSFWKLLVAIGIGQVITSVLLVPYFMKTLFSVPLVTTIPGRAISQAVQIPLYAFITQTIQKRLSVVYANE